nr:galactose mutarotase [Treponema sp.]
MAIESVLNGKVGIEEKTIGDGVKLFTVSNGKVSFSVMNYGCTVTRLLVPDRDGRATDIVLGFDDLAGYESCTDSRGAVVGRVANRISGASFTMDGKVYDLDKNDGGNTLHGGFTRFEKMLWEADTFFDENADGHPAGVVFRRTSRDGEQGFPGNLDITVVYSLNSRDELTFSYRAVPDRKTPVNMTNHTYFNLNGVLDSKRDVLNHVMTLDSDKILEIDGQLIPTGRILDVSERSEFDFRKGKEVGMDIGKCDERIGGGYDNCFVTKAFGGNAGKPVFFGTVSSPITGISMDMFTDQEGMQVYSGNFLDGGRGKGGFVDEKYGGICFESQRLVDSVNRKEFPSPFVEAGGVYSSTTVYRFGNC